LKRYNQDFGFGGINNVFLYVQKLKNKYTYSTSVLNATNLILSCSHSNLKLTNSIHYEFLTQNILQMFVILQTNFVKIHISDTHKKILRTFIDINIFKKNIKIENVICLSSSTQVKIFLKLYGKEKMLI